MNGVPSKEELRALNNEGLVDRLIKEAMNSMEWPNRENVAAVRRELLRRLELRRP